MKFPYVFTFVYLVAFCTESVNLNPAPAGKNIISGDATVQLVDRRTKRSIDSQNDHDQHEIDINVSAFGITHKLALKSQPKGSFISDKFRMKRIYTGSDGNSVWEDVTPSEEEIAQIEENMFVDVQTNSAVLIEQNPYHSNSGDLNLSVNGVVNDARIRKKRSSDGSSSGNRDHVVEFVDYHLKQYSADQNKKDYIDIGTEDDLNRRGGEEKLNTPRSSPFSAVIELAYVVDFKTTSVTFKKDRKKMLEYYAIMTNSVNNKYALTEDPMVRCRMISLLIIEDEKQQPFLNDAKLVNGTYDMFVILPSFSNWVLYNLDKVGAHDVSPLMLGVEFSDPTIAGLAYAGGACIHNYTTQKGENRSRATPCCSDVGGIFDGTFSTAHEILHNLGAQHDGDNAAQACPWDEGFIMSYKGWGFTHHWKMSKCTEDAIRNYMSKYQCPFHQTSQVSITSPIQVGEYVKDDVFCTIQKGPEWIRIYLSPDIDCRITVCRKRSEAIIEVVGRPPGNGAPCGDKGKCQNGFCLKQVSRKPAGDLDDLCRKITLNDKATWSDSRMESFFKLAGGTATNKIASKCFGIFCNNPGEDDKGKFTDKNSVAFVPADTTTVCGKGKICDGINCVDEQTTDIFKCVKHTHQESKYMEYVKQPSNDKCVGGIQCVFDRYYTEYITKPTPAKCGKQGHCFNGVCIEVNPKGKTTLTDVCRKVMGEKNGVIVFPALYIDEPCSNLKCRNKKGKLYVSGVDTPDGVTCAPFRVCKKGKCVLCTQKSK